MSSKKVLMIAPEYYGLDKPIARAFEKNGFEICHMNYRINLFGEVLGELTRHYPSTKKILNSLLKVQLIKENRKYISLAKAFNPSFVFVIKGETIFPETIRYLKKYLGLKFISYQWDDPFFSFPEAIPSDDFRSSNFNRGINDYDHIFVFDKHYVEEVEKRGNHHVSYLPLAADEELFKKMHITDEERALYGYDVCFVGVPFKNRIDLLNSLKGLNIGVFGDYWDKQLDKLNGNYYRGKASGETVRKIYCASKIVLNINHPQSKHGVNTRAFEIPSCSAFGIVDYIDGIEDLFKLGEEIVCYRNTIELKELINYYLAHPEERYAIADKGYKRVQQEHTWFHRVKEIIDIVS